MNQVALITGSARGLGKAFCEAILKKGGKVCVVDVLPEGQSTVDKFNIEYGGKNAIFVCSDVSQYDQLKSAFEKTKEIFGRIDIVCNNAAVFHEGNGMWEKMVAVNLVGSINGTKLGIEYLRNDRGGQEGGVIVNVSSMAGLDPFPDAPIYSATKHGIIGFSRSYGTHPKIMSLGIRINCLCPSYVRTDMLIPIPGTMFEDLISTGFSNPELSMEPEEAAKGFIQLLEDTSLKAAVLKASKKDGFVFHDYTK